MGESQELPLPQGTYGFIGIGVMGFPMAQNLRRKMPKESKLLICEVNQSQIDQFLDETQPREQIEVISTPKEIAEKAVGENKSDLGKSADVVLGHHNHNAACWSACEEGLHR